MNQSHEECVQQLLPLCREELKQFLKAKDESSVAGECINTRAVKPLSVRTLETLFSQLGSFQMMATLYRHVKLSNIILIIVIKDVKLL